MKRIETDVKNKIGLNARPATFFVMAANQFKCSIWIELGTRRVNAKSLLGILSLGCTGGNRVTIIADGADEEAAIERLQTILDTEFKDERKVMALLGAS